MIHQTIESFEMLIQMERFEDYNDPKLMVLAYIRTLKSDVKIHEEKLAEKICENYCKYPETWDKEKEGCALEDSDICMNCPLCGERVIEE